jgi:hypothetical protein
VINETRERFIKSVAEKIAIDRVVEAYFFPSIRQGQVETGVAVLAATRVPAAATDAPEVDTANTVDRAEVFTATYRWTRKGPDRGKWIVDVKSEADAPLATVETVVRGVQERAGEALDAHRMTGAELVAIAPPPEAIPHSPEPAASAATTPGPIPDSPATLNPVAP